MEQAGRQVPSNSWWHRVLERETWLPIDEAQLPDLVIPSNCVTRIDHGPKSIVPADVALHSSDVRSHVLEVGVKKVGVFAAVLIAAIVAGSVSAGATNPDGPSTSLRTEKPKVLCMKYRSERLFVRARPANCDFIDANADLDSLTSWALIPTRSVRWTHWGHRSALGKGKGFMRGVGWRPNRVRLSRPRVVCGRKVFTRFKGRMNVPGQGWSSWGRRVPIMGCG